MPPTRGPKLLVSTHYLHVPPIAVTLHPLQQLLGPSPPQTDPAGSQQKPEVHGVLQHPRIAPSPHVWPNGTHFVAS
jgi:hypothetical protein